MTTKKLHPSVQKFKEFVKKNPKMVLEVRRGNATWQDLYEEWYLLGEEDSRWDEFKEVKEEETSEPKEDKKEWFPKIFNAMKNMEPEQLQGHIYSISQALGAVQGLLSQFQAGNSSKGTVQNQATPPQHPFHFRKD